MEDKSVIFRYDVIAEDNQFILRGTSKERPHTVVESELCPLEGSVHYCLEY